MNDGGPVAESESYADRYFTTKDGLKLHYRDYPGSKNKPPLLCLHGLTRNSRDFADFAQRHSPAWRCLALDFRGRGMSDYDPVPDRYTPLTYAGDVIQLLDDLMIEGAVFVGTSLGGLVTMTMAAMAPKRIAAAILNDVGPDVDASGVDRILAYVGKDRRFGNWDEAADAIASNYGSAFENYRHEDFVAMAKRNCREENGEIRFDYDMAIAEPFRTSGPVPRVDLWPLFTALGQKPLLVVRGERSDLLTADTLRKMHDAVPDMKSVTVSGIGHAPMLDEPEALAAIDQFLSSLDLSA
ncbi:MAG TPA: alpha/beta hydrolase [Sphingomicrobium sp.]|nr:alpha/beta hydrolase [Sphingomicrobium sp.]